MDIEQIIRVECAKLPTYCISDGRTGWTWDHDWINVYNLKGYPVRTPINGAQVQARYQMCRYCHRRSDDDRQTINYVDPTPDQQPTVLKALKSSYYDDDGFYKD